MQARFFLTTQCQLPVSVSGSPGGAIDLRSREEWNVCLNLFSSIVREILMCLQENVMYVSTGVQSIVQDKPASYLTGCSTLNLLLSFFLQ